MGTLKTRQWSWGWEGVGGGDGVVGGGGGEALSRRWEEGGEGVK